MLYEDDAVVALNKPAKLLAVPANDSASPSALSLLSAERKTAFHGIAKFKHEPIWGRS